MHTLSDGGSFIQVTLADSTGDVFIDIGYGHPQLVIVIYTIFVRDCSLAVWLEAGCVHIATVYHGVWF